MRTAAVCVISCCQSAVYCHFVLSYIHIKRRCVCFRVAYFMYFCLLIVFWAHLTCIILKPEYTFLKTDYKRHLVLFFMSNISSFSSQTVTDWRWPSSSSCWIWVQVRATSMIWNWESHCFLDLALCTGGIVTLKSSPNSGKPKTLVP